MIQLKFYTKPGCWFCDQAEEMLIGQRERYGLEIQRLDITQDDELYDLYRYDVPVVEFPDGSLLYQHIKRKQLMEKLNALNK
jgi:glutaredoxin